MMHHASLPLSSSLHYAFTLLLMPLSKSKSQSQSVTQLVGIEFRLIQTVAVYLPNSLEILCHWSTRTRIPITAPSYLYDALVYEL